MSRRLLACAMATGALLATAAPALADSAPGRVLLPTDAGVANNPDIGGTGLAVALPDGGALVQAPSSLGANGFALAKITASGALDTSFATNGFRGVTANFGVLQIVRGADGKLLVAGIDFKNDRLAVERLNADATPDTSFGGTGIVSPPVAPGCGGPPCAIAAFAPDGGVVIAGRTGQFGKNIDGSGGTVRWALAKLTPSGAPDNTFGQGGVVQVSTLSATAISVIMLPDGKIVTDGQSTGLPGSMLLTRLTAAGAPDPTFAGGVPITLPFSSAFPPPIVGDDGSVLVAGQTSGLAVPPFTPGHQLLARYTSTGTPDPAFGAAGVADYGNKIQIEQLLPAGGGRLLANVRRETGLLPIAGTPAGTLAFVRLAPDGAVDPSFGSPTVKIGFGGGYTSFVVSVHPRPLPSLSQNTFGGTMLVPRPDGSYLVAGGVGVAEPTGEGEGFSIGRIGIAALTPGLALDPAFGGPATAPTAGVRLIRQRAATARKRHGIRVTFTASAPGTCRVRIKAAGRTIAASVLPIFKAGKVTLPVELTHAGNRYLSGHRRNVRVTVDATLRDLLTSKAPANTNGRLS